MRTFTAMRKLILLVVILLLPVIAITAQEATPEPLPLPSQYQVTGFNYEAQWWNNCGPATLTMALSHFGYSENQSRAANWLKPNTQDKNVSPWQMVDFVNTQVPEIPVYAMQRFGGDLDTLRTLIANDFVVIIEAGYDPPRAAQGWMGHYLLVNGYDDFNGQVITQDSYDGANHPYSYEHIQEFWEHFNYLYIVLFTADREDELLTLLGDDADEYQNLVNAFNIARAEATDDPNDSFAWHNMGAMLVELAKRLDNQEYYGQAAIAFDQARNVGDGLPWRMPWYQFWMYEAYNAVGRYQDTIDIAGRVLNDGGGQFVEETYYYAGIAREGMGERQRAVTNYTEAIRFNPNFTPAQERLTTLQQGG
jgi:hypothetical protein